MNNKEIKKILWKKGTRLLLIEKSKIKTSRNNINAKGIEEKVRNNN